MKFFLEVWNGFVCGCSVIAFISLIVMNPNMPTISVTVGSAVVNNVHKILVEKRFIQ